jgi:hypothetical protein
MSRHSDVAVAATPSRPGPVPADLIHEIIQGVLHDQASGEALPHLGDEVCVRLDRLQRAWTTVQGREPT